METESNFRIQNKRLMLTYSQGGHLNKETFTKWVTEKCQTAGISWIRLAHETGENGTNPHTHVLIEFTKTFNTRNARFFDYMNHHPNIKFFKSAKAFEDAKKYIAKEDPENIDLKQQGKGITVAQVTAHETAEKAIDAYMENNFQSVSGILAVYNLKKLEMKRFNWEPSKEWQEKICELTEIEPNNRDIWWIYDKTGNSGKTSLCKYLCANYPNKWAATKDMGTSRDAATIIANIISAGWEAWGLLLDLPRSAENHVRIYAYIEEIKDGMITTQKYSGKPILFDSPHVIIFANWLPKTHCMSKDRWKIFNITGSETLKPMTLKEVEIEQGTEYIENETPTFAGL